MTFPGGLGVVSDMALLLAVPVAFRHHQFSQFGRHQPCLFVRKIPYVNLALGLREALALGLAKGGPEALATTTGNALGHRLLYLMIGTLAICF